MKKDIIVYLEDILEAIDKIEKYVKDLKEKDFYKIDQIQDSVIRRLEIIGEATKNIPADLKTKYQSIPWKRMSGLRDVLSHEYWGIDLKRIWNITTKRLPSLKKEIKELLSRKRK
ncbi:hypothetical protein A3A46_04160 [Candidatus Roizmanbacteria bacterium RIFCSPLOWO2_01_FULL_37_13]|uniref:DUF86 domain-containing protein n=1 Tax=Candidatus Roizmanbacteria bacterium RIFCSPHIGHO2_02_FULL_38_11 TaxID=1802039 RepID=A0A1F7H2Y8_9BACT|nr:MAG: hypothetical protein A3C25_03275 [Candidatus Roizmanbacteria bacterium RIFCSPHIGHO2_02_FULL_38_11]OGK35089.1 MAG: hypothetical protein A3F58_01925 [Candidatus Roizmanbacteria bacterium RIFCSPHIGHO2_12_FULL_37_9b]OGK40969.1 MAG: hypothetical protein A3A46_04160 [Candidatus Roizmanbacteria bacterium RIFCSPLOWO2_01_FULL_37_13]